MSVRHSVSVHVFGVSSLEAVAFKGTRWIRIGDEVTLHIDLPGAIRLASLLTLHAGQLQEDAIRKPEEPESVSADVDDEVEQRYAEMLLNDPTAAAGAD